MNWETKYCDELNDKTLEGLLENRHCFVVVKNFLAESECHKIVNYLKDNDVIKKYDYNFDSAESPEAFHYMTTHYLFEEDADKNNYKLQAQDSIDKYEAMSQSIGFDPLVRMDKLISKGKNSVVQASEEGFKYSRAMIRSLYGGALLHADFAPFINQQWAIKSIDAELAWNFYLELPEKGGETNVFNKQWQKEDDQHLITKDSYGYDSQVVKGSESSQHTAAIGDLVLFNSRNFHEVLKSEGAGDRITMGGHLGRSKTNPNQLLSWI